MKNLVLVLALMLSSVIYAQNDVTKFLGIPVDGTKVEMKKKLIAKGFTPTKIVGSDFLEGQFNGISVRVYIVTNNNKVCRIAVHDASTCDEAQIRIRFNNLIYQFKNNKRYTCLVAEGIPESEDISYEMTFNSKSYQAAFCQDSDENKLVWFGIWQNSYTKYSLTIYYENEYNKANGEDL
jgi:hypothetical protein